MPYLIPICFHDKGSMSTACPPLRFWIGRVSESQYFNSCIFRGHHLGMRVIKYWYK